MPAGRGNACDACYWKATFAKRLRLDEAALSSQRFSSLFHSFGIWLVQQVPPQKAALTIHGYLPFFCELEEHWRAIPSYPELLRHFTAEGLRRVRLPMRWLAETGQVTVSDEEREDASDVRRIDTMIASIPLGSVASTALAAYRAELQEKVTAGRTSVRSLRLALRPALSLLQCTDTYGRLLPGQSTLDRYLLNAPGQKAAVTGFISFLNRRYGSALVARLDLQQHRSLQQRKLEAELASLFASCERDGEFLTRWITVSLQYFHGLPRSVGRRLAAGAVTVDTHGFAVDWNGASHWVPHWDYRPGETGSPAVATDGGALS